MNKVDYNRFDKPGGGRGGGDRKYTSAFKKPEFKRQDTELLNFSEEEAVESDIEDEYEDQFNYEIESDEDGELVFDEETGEWVEFNEFIARLPEPERLELEQQERERQQRRADKVKLI